MTLPDFDRGEIASNPNQAESLQRAIEALFEGEVPAEYVSSIYKSCSDIVTPHKVSLHLPMSGAASINVTDSAFIQYMYDRKTGEIRNNGVVGMVSFTRREEVAKGVIYACHVNYHVTKSDGIFGIERHVKNTEHGRRMVTGALGRTARNAVDPAAQLKELLDLKARIDESRPIEKAMGMFDVSASETEAVISFVRGAL